MVRAAFAATLGALFLAAAVFNLFSTGRPLPELSRAISCGRGQRAATSPFTVELVVSLCNESLEWLPHAVRAIAALPAAPRVVAITLYRKCGAPPVPAVDGAPPPRVVRLPNVGRCDHTYLHHIAENYYHHSREEEAEGRADLTLFLPGSLYDIGHKRRGFLENVVPHLSACAHFIGAVPSRVDPFFFLDAYCASDAANAAVHGQCALIAAPQRPFARWWRLSVDPHHYPPTLGSFGGVFAASRAAIRGRPLSLWRRLRDQTAVGNNPEVGHYVERSWQELLAPQTLASSSFWSYVDKY